MKSNLNSLPWNNEMFLEILVFCSFNLPWFKMSMHLYLLKTNRYIGIETPESEPGPGNTGIKSLSCNQLN